MRNLRLQGSIYHARLTIPPDVRQHFGNKAEFSKSLETGKLSLAVIRAGEIVADWKREIALARLDAKGLPANEWAKDWAKTLRQADDTNGRVTRERIEFSNSPELIEFTHPSSKEVLELVLEGETEARVKSGKLSSQDLQESFEIIQGTKVTLRDYREEYLKQFSRNPIKTQAAYTRALDHFLERFKLSTEVTPKSIRSWLTYLAEERELAAKTIGRLLGTARTFWGYLVEKEILTGGSTPFSGVPLTIPKSAKRSTPIRPFAPEEIVAILNSSKTQKDPQLSLLIILAMYTGARIEELASLKWSDVDSHSEVLTIRGTKTEAAENRQVPMHPVLLATLGPFPLADNDGYVIHGLTVDSRGDRSKAIGKRFGRIKTELGFKGRERCFHSIRKTVVTLLERADVREAITADIVGHEKQTITYGLYSGGSSISQKREAIHKLSYPKLY